MSEEGLKVLTRKRGGLKSAIVRIQSAVNSFDINLTTKHFLTVRLESLKSLASKYDEVQSEIELISKDVSTAQADRVEVEEMIYSTEANILQLLDTVNTPVSYTHLDVYKRQLYIYTHTHTHTHTHIHIQ